MGRSPPPFYVRLPLPWLPAHQEVYSEFAGCGASVFLDPSVGAGRGGHGCPGTPVFYMCGFTASSSSWKRHLERSLPE